jgi:hypothetical protein
MSKISAWCGKLLSLAALVCLVLGGPRLSDAADAGAVFTPGPEMKVARELFNLAALPGGQVAVFGGYYYTITSISLSSAEIWNPSTHQFQFISTEMDYTRALPGFVKLADGSYLLAGGGLNTISAEIFRPEYQDFFLVSGQMAYGRAFCGAALLTSGKALVVGADSYTAATYAELYDPVHGTFSTSQALNTPRAMPLVLPCNDGQAVVLGGFYPFDISKKYEQVELYNPVTNGFTILQEQLFPGDPGWSIVGSAGQIYYTSSVETQRLQDGRYLLLAQKDNYIPSYTLFTFDPATKAIAKFTTTPDFPSSFIMSYWPVVNAAQGKAYLLSTDSHSGSFKDVRLYTVDLATGRRNDPTGSFPLSATFVNGFGVTLLADGRLFLAGGDEIVNSAIQSVKKTWFIKPNGSPVGSMGLLLLD